MVEPLPPSSPAVEMKKLTLLSGIESNPPPKGQGKLSTDAEINGGSAELPGIDNSRSAEANGELSLAEPAAELASDAPAIPRADAIDGLAHGADHRPHGGGSVDSPR